MAQDTEYWKYRTACFLSRSFPRPLAYWIGLRIADGFYRRRVEDRRAVLSNLRQIFIGRGIAPSEDTLDGLARKTFQHFGKYLIDFFRFSCPSKRQLSKLVSFEHREYFEEAYDKGKGVISITAHFGNYELAGAVIAALGYPMNAVFLPQRLKKLDNLLCRQRLRRGVQPIPLGHAASGTFRCLRRGEVVGLLADRDFTTKDDRIEFFVEPARLPTGPARLALRTGAPIVPAFLVREVDDTFRMKFHPPIYPGKVGDEDDIRRIIRDVLEQEIGDNPTQWFIFDDFWADGDRAQYLRNTKHGDTDDRS